MGLFGPTRKIIKTRQVFSVGEVVETFTQQGGFPFIPFTKKVLGREYIYFPGDGKEDIHITVKKDKIIITHTDKPTVGKTVAKSLGGVVGGAIAGAIDAAKGKDSATPEWAIFLGKDDYTMDDIILAVTNRAQQLFG